MSINIFYLWYYGMRHAVMNMGYTFCTKYYRSSYDALVKTRIYSLNPYAGIDPSAGIDLSVSLGIE